MDFDKDNNGYLDMDELETCLLRFGCPPRSTEDYEFLIKTFDTDSRYSLSYPDYIDVYNSFHLNDLTL